MGSRGTEENAKEEVTQRGDLAETDKRNPLGNDHWPLPLNPHTTNNPFLPTSVEPKLVFHAAKPS